MSKESTISRISQFHPGWTATSLGTAGVAVATLFNPISVSKIDNQLGILFTAIATLLLAAILPVNIVRFVRHRDEMAKDLANPGLGAMFGTIPAALIVTSLAIAQLGVDEVLPAKAAGWIAFTMAALGVALALTLGVLFFTRIVQKTEFPVAAISGAWFIPIVVLVLTPSVFIRTERLLDQVSLNLTYIASMALWGAGFVLFIFLGSVVAWRLITTPAPPAHMAASWFIWLAPASAGALGYIAILRWSSQIYSATGSLEQILDLFAVIFAVTLWGFATWWLGFAGWQILLVRREMGIHIGSWGFSFPFAAYTALSLEIGRMTENQALSVFATISWIALIGLWLRLSYGTLKEIRSGAIYQR